MMTPKTSYRSPNVRWRWFRTPCSYQVPQNANYVLDWCDERARYVFVLSWAAASCSAELSEPKRQKSRIGSRAWRLIVMTICKSFLLSSLDIQLQHPLHIMFRIDQSWSILYLQFWITKSFLGVWQDTSSFITVDYLKGNIRLIKMQRWRLQITITLITFLNTSSKENNMIFVRYENKACGQKTKTPPINFFFDQRFSTLSMLQIPWLQLFL